MKLMTITIEVNDMSLSSNMSINKEAFEKYKDDYGFETPEKLYQQSQHVMDAVSELTSELASKYKYIRKSKGEDIEVLEFHNEEIDVLMKLLGIKK